MNIRCLGLAAMILVCLDANAYQEQTHQDLSESALVGSVMAADPMLLRHFGLKPFTDATQEFENSSGFKQTIRRLVRFGAEHEDSTSPQVRPKNHFFDPQHNGVGLLYWLGTPSPSWILEGEGQGDEFSYRKATEHLVAALSTFPQSVREKHWGLVFQNLGHVIHHIQDMAQPQHVRDDLHVDKDQADAGIQQAFASLVHDPSHYERYTQSGTGRMTWEPLAQQAVPAVIHSRAREYWSNAANTGMADFTSRNFVSKGTNFGLNGGSVVTDGSFPLPVPQKPIPASRVRLDDPALGLANGTSLCEALKAQRESGQVQVPPSVDCEIEFVATAVEGARPGEAAINPRAASLSLFDAELLTYGKSYTYVTPGGSTVRKAERSFTLNHFNFEAAYPYLIPRAVAHSTGLINHFFRGRMEMVDAGLEGDRTRIRIRNVSASGNSFGPGTFRLYYDSADGSRKSLPIESGVDLGAGQFHVGETHELAFMAPEDIDLVQDDPYVLVYEGKVGAEEAVAGQVFSAPDGMGGFIYNAQRLTLSSNGQGLRAEDLGDGLLYRRNGIWKRRSLVGHLQSGQTDWKGWFVDGRPTRQLSWDFGGVGIFSGGKLLATAPCPVLGAALQKNGNDVPWVIVICSGNASEHVLRKPADRNTQADTWSTIAEIQNPDHLKASLTAWRFNGSGTEAQGMRALKSTSATAEPGLTHYTRLRIRVEGGSASLADMGNSQIVRHVTVDHAYDCKAGTVDTRDVTTATGATVVAVDYVDDQAVFATLKASVERSRLESGTLGDGYISTLAIGEQVNTVWTLNVAGQEHEWVTEMTDYQVEKDGNGDLRVQSNVMSTQGYFVSLDLRSGLLILEHEDFEQVASDNYPGSGSGSTVRDESRARAFRIHGPGSKSLADLDLISSHVSQSRPALDVLAEISSRTQVCLDGDPAEQQDRSEDYIESVAPPLYGGRWSTPTWQSKASVSHAMDLSGNLFLSAFVYEGPDQTGQVGYTYYNYLTDGDPMQIAFPNAGGKAHFNIRLR